MCSYQSDIHIVNRVFDLMIFDLTRYSRVNSVCWRNSFFAFLMPKGVYPQRDGSLAIVAIDASKGFIDLWIHFFVAIEDIHRNWFRLNSNMFNISFSMGMFSY